jgi:hypothetical protein
MDKAPMTSKGHDDLEAELKRLKTVERPDIIKAIRSPANMATCRRTPNTTPRASIRVLSKAASWNSRISSAVLRSSTSKR